MDSMAAETTVPATMPSIASSLPYPGATELTVSSRRVLRYATEEAVYLNHVRVGVEHLLLGLLRENEHLAASVFKHRGVTLPLARATIDLIAGASRGDDLVDDPSPGGAIGLNPAAQRVMDAATTLAARELATHVAPEHIARAFSTQPDGICAGTIETFASYVAELLE